MAQLSFETYHRALEGNWDYSINFFQAVYELVPNVHDALCFLEYWSSETLNGTEVEGSLEEYYEDFKEVAGMY